MQQRAEKKNADNNALPIDEKRNVEFKVVGRVGERRIHPIPLESGAAHTFGPATTRGRGVARGRPQTRGREWPSGPRDRLTRPVMAAPAPPRGRGGVPNSEARRIGKLARSVPSSTPMDTSAVTSTPADGGSTRRAKRRWTAAESVSDASRDLTTARVSVEDVVDDVDEGVESVQEDREDHNQQQRDILAAMSLNRPSRQ